MKKNFSLWLRKNTVLLFFPLFIVLISFWLLWRHYQRSPDEVDFVHMIETKLLDWRFSLRGDRQPQKKVGILAIDEKSIQKFGRWPFPRRIYKRVLQNLKSLDVSWIGLDSVYSESEEILFSDILGEIKTNTSKIKYLNKLIATSNSSQLISPGDKNFAEAIREFEHLVMGYFYVNTPSAAKELKGNPFKDLSLLEDSQIDGIILPEGKNLSDYKELNVYGLVANTQNLSLAARHFAFFNNQPDYDAIVRWITLVRVFKGRLMPSLSLKLAAAALDKEIMVVFDRFGVEEIMLIDEEDDNDVIQIPVDPQGLGRVLIDHLGSSGTLPHFSLADAYDNQWTDKQKRFLKKSILVLGPTAIGIGDIRPNPFDSKLNGVENHATFLENILSNRFMKRPHNIYLLEMKIVLIIGILLTFLFLFSSALYSFLFVLIFSIIYFYFDKYYLFNKGIWAYIGIPYLEVFSIYISMSFYQYMTEEKERKKVKGAFSLYLSSDIIKQVLNDPEALKLGGEKRDLTVLFSDVRGFTTISEALSPEKLSDLMNAYFTPMTKIIMNSGGVLDKYIGDAIMAFWGAPLMVPNQADCAAIASMKMLYALDYLQKNFKKKNLPRIDIGIGLNSGFMAVGNMGSNERFCYTVMGDSVNLGARLEGLTKEYGVKIILSEFTQQKLTHPELLTRDLDDIRVKGKYKPVKIFELLRPDVVRNRQSLHDLIGEFERGREEYLARNWQNSEKYFIKCIKIKPKDGPSVMYLRRLKDYQASPPAKEKWDGIYTFTHK